MITPQRTGATALGMVLLLALPRPLPAATFREAPMLRARVEAGELPPVSQRLPADPMVVRPYERVGIYGGRLRVITGEAQRLIECLYMLMTPLLRFASDGRTIVPNVARHWEMSDDGRVFTIYLRRGMKWSDGVPVTVRDVQFAWEDILLDPELTPVVPVAFSVAGKPMKVEPVDDHTFRLVFAEPYGALPYFLTRTQQVLSLVQPAHYLKRFHRNYAPLEDLERMARDHGVERWYELFTLVNFARKAPGPTVPPDFPTLAPWQVAESPATGHVILRRNPFHWQVDTEGNQLPYIDEIHSQWFGNPEARNLKAVTGEIDFVRSFARFNDAPLFLSNQAKGNYRVMFWKANHGTRVAYYFNQTHVDPAKRAVYQDRRFRIALSHAIDRDEINDVVYYGQGKPRQDTANSVSSFFEPHFATAHLAYDPERAERMLDEIGLHRRGVAGWRTLPSGRTLSITLDVFPLEPYGRSAELIREYWQSVGILINCRTVQGALTAARVQGNEHDVVGYPNDVATDPMVINRPLYEINAWAPLWSRWFQSPEDRRHGERPPRAIVDLYDAWRELRTTTVAEQRVRLGKQIMQYQADHLLAIGTVGETLNPVIVANRLHNVPRWRTDENGRILEGQRALSGWPWLATFLHHPEQWFLEETP